MLTGTTVCYEEATALCYRNCLLIERCMPERMEYTER